MFAGACGTILPAMADETELELLITVVVAADGDRDAREACRDLVRRVGGRIVESGDCSDEEPGCWSVTLLRGGEETGHPVGAAALSRAVRNFMRELGPAYSSSRVSCEPPTAWTVVDNPDLVSGLVDGGERLLVEAWLGGSVLPMTPPEPTHRHGPGAPDAPDDHEMLGDPDEPGPVDELEPRLDDVDENGRPRARLGMVVDVVTQRRSGAEWPARALASRLSRTVTVTGSAERPPTVRVVLDLGPAEGEVAEILSWAVSELDDRDWSRPRGHATSAVARWSPATTPHSGIAAIELRAFDPASGGTAPDRSAEELGTALTRASEALE